MVTAAYNDFKPRDWSEVAADFEAICAEKFDQERDRKSGRRSMSRIDNGR